MKKKDLTPMNSPMEKGYENRISKLEAIVNDFISYHTNFLNEQIAPLNRKHFKEWERTQK